MPIDINDIPLQYRNKVDELSRHITFDEIKTKGANGFVICGHNNLLGRHVAVKFYYWGDGAHVEPAHLSRLEHDAILKVDHAEAINEDDAYFITRYCEGGDLDDYIAVENIGLRSALSIVLSIASGVSYLHGNSYVHRDLKPSNIFVRDDGKYVVGDFGSVVALVDNVHAQSLTKHSIIYRPPEDFDGNVFYKEGDIYQIGIVLYQLLGGFFPYDEDDWLKAKEIVDRDKLDRYDAQIFANGIIENRIKKGRILDFSSLPFFVPPKVIRIIKRACHIERSKRYSSVSDLMTELNNTHQRAVDWCFEDGFWVAKGKKRSFRCFEVDGNVVVEKNLRGAWRRDNSIKAKNLRDAASEVCDML